MIREICRRDPVFFINTFGIVREPRAARILPDDHQVAPVRDVPFILYPFQRELVEFLVATLRGGQQGLVPKSRDMGVTWTALWLIWWAVLFVPGFSAHIGSRIADLVDMNPRSRNEDTLFGKLEIICDATPDFLKPGGLDLRDEKQRQMMMLLLPNGNAVTGEAASANFARGSRHTLVLMDEGDHWKDLESAIAGAQDNAAAIWLVTTPNPYGQGTVKKIIEEKLFEVFVVHWTSHPTKDLKWYQQQAKRRFKDRMAQELDISFVARADLQVYPEWLDAEFGDFPYAPTAQTICGMDYGRADGSGLVWFQRSPATGQVTFLASYYNKGELIDYYLPFLGRPIASGKHKYTSDELELIAWLNATVYKNPVNFFGDPAGQQKTQVVNESVFDVLRENGIFVQASSGFVRYEERIQRTRLLLRGCRVNIARCAALDTSIRNYRYRQPRANIIDVRTLNKPVHNEYSHLPTAVEHAAEAMAVFMRLGASAQPRHARHAAAWE